MIESMRTRFPSRSSTVRLGKSKVGSKSSSSKSRLEAKSFLARFSSSSSLLAVQSHTERNEEKQEVARGSSVAGQRDA